MKVAELFGMRQLADDDVGAGKSATILPRGWVCCDESVAEKPCELPWLRLLFQVTGFLPYRFTT